MGRDKRIYRFVQDTRFGRIVIAESHEVPAILDAVTDYVARRMVEREHALVATPIPEPAPVEKKRRGGFWTFALGFHPRRAGAVRPRPVRDAAEHVARHSGARRLARTRNPAAWYVCLDSGSALKKRVPE